MVFLIMVTPDTCMAITPNERRWETADLIIEGRIIETQTIEDKKYQQYRLTEYSRQRP